jgi:CheY-like chemotaxis protein
MKPKRVLIVDDESGFTRLLKLTLEKTRGYTVREVNDGTQAWLVAREFHPDIIFLDVVMPAIDGGDVAQQIRSDPTLAHVPIIFLTAIVSSKEGGQEIGGFPFLAKPVSVDSIIKAVQEHTGPDEESDDVGPVPAEGA